MTSYRTLAASILLASSLGVLAAPAVAAAQERAPAEARSDFFEHRAERMEQHHQKLHAALKLTPDQEGAWKKLMDSERPGAKAEPGKSEDWAKLTTPERAERMLERMKLRQAHLAEHVAAIKDFYAVLTPEQKKTFDDFHAAPRRGMRGQHSPRNPESDKASPKP